MNRIQSAPLLTALLLAACASQPNAEPETTEIATATDGVADVIVEESVAVEELSAEMPDNMVAPTPDLGADVDSEMAKAVFERLKKLAGRWEHVADEAAEGEETMPAGMVVTYEVTSGGSAVLETEFAGQPHEMLTIYTLNQGRLVLTHYCAMNNQPYMVATGIPDADHVSFEAVALGNAPSLDAPHMHWAEMEFVNADHVRTRWTIRANGKPGFVGKMNLKRAVE